MNIFACRIPKKHGGEVLVNGVKADLQIMYVVKAHLGVVVLTLINLTILGVGLQAMYRKKTFWLDRKPCAKPCYSMLILKIRLL